MRANKCYIEIENERALRNLTGESMSVSIHVGSKDNDIKVMSIQIEKIDEHTFSVIAIAEETRDRLETITDIDNIDETTILTDDSPPLLDSEEE